MPNSDWSMLDGAPILIGLVSDYAKILIGLCSASRLLLIGSFSDGAKFSMVHFKTVPSSVWFMLRL
jgi:hypothetical protein